MRTLIAYCALFLIATSSFSQSSSSEGLGQKWKGMLEKAETYQTYKVIKISELDNIWRAVTDTVKVLKSNVSVEKQTVVDQNARITSLEKQIADLKSQLQIEMAEKESMLFMGSQVNKYTYVNTLWFILGAVVLGCAVLFFLYTMSNRITTQKIAQYEELFGEFEEYKKNSLEKERKLKRELQTLSNKIEEMKTGKNRVF